MIKTAEIILSNGERCLVDIVDYDRLVKYPWHKHPMGYAYAHLSSTLPDRKNVLMHRFILDNPKSHVDHINGDKLDNRRINLRPATTSQNNANQKKQLNRTSIYKGVYWNKNRSRWQAQTKLDGKSIWLGTFDSEAGAAKAYNKAAREYFREYAKLNEIIGE